MLLRSFPALLCFSPLLAQTLVIRTDNAGNGQENDDQCFTYQTCGEKGLALWNLLHSNLSSAHPYIRKDESATFTTYYDAKLESYWFIDPDLEQDFRNNRLDSEHLDVWSVMSKDPVTGVVSKDDPYTNVFDTNQGIIVAEGNWRYLDVYKKLEWSELMYQTWQLAKEKADHQHQLDKSHPPGKPISSISSVVQHIVANHGTKDILKVAYNACKYSINAGDITWYKWTETDNRYYFYALLATDNVKGTLWLLNDHSVEIGKKEITEIWTRWTTMNPDIWYVTFAYASQSGLSLPPGAVRRCVGPQDYDSWPVFYALVT